jgi:hypothetical protein
MRFDHGIAGVVVALCACTGQPAADLPDDLLGSGQEFIEVPRLLPDQVASAMPVGGHPVIVQDGDHNFYLAIRKDGLSQRWFLSAYAKQWYPGDVSFGFADVTLGTRAVSFKQQNDKLFVFDASDQFKTSEIEDPTVLVEAWPVIDLPAFDRLRSSNQYVLVDPSAGLNKFGVTGEVFGDPSAGSAVPVRVGVAFMQNFRKLGDGAAFEEVFAGDLNGSSGFAQSVWGTLGISLQRYSVGDGYVPTPDPGTPFYFMSDRRLATGTGGFTETNPVKFNLHPGMKPIDVVVTQGIKRAQADFPGFDLMGAVQRGIEKWNDVFGFSVFRTVFVDSDAVPNDDQSFILVDYPGGAPFAFADWRSNPDNGETRGMSVYFSGAFFDQLPGFVSDPVAPPSVAPPSAPVHHEHPVVRSLTWAGMPVHRPGCVLWSDDLDPFAGQAAGDTQLTAQEKGARYIQQGIAHEVGHTLGLRHNFKGSLEPPSSSVMDYLNRQTGRIQRFEPGPYDVDAIRYLYGLSPSLPFNHPFCTDEQVSFDPTCQTNDEGANPLYDYWAPQYRTGLDLIFTSGFPIFFADSVGLNQVLEFARDPGFVPATQHTDAIHIALDRAAVPLAPADAANPLFVTQANLLAEAVLRRIALDEGFIGNIQLSVSDPGVTSLLAEQAGRMLRNEDGVRTVQLRRSTVDVLKKLQTDAAFLELRQSRDAVTAALADGTVPPADVPFVEDLLTRIGLALTPYFQ